MVCYPICTHDLLTVISNQMTNIDALAKDLYNKVYKEISGWAPKETEALRLEKAEKGWHGQKLADLKNQEIASGQTKQAIGFLNLMISENGTFDSYTKLKMLLEVAIKIKKRAEDPRIYTDPKQKEIADQIYLLISAYLKAHPKQ